MKIFTTNKVRQCKGCGLVIHKGEKYCRHGTTLNGKSMYNAYHLSCFDEYTTIRTKTLDKEDELRELTNRLATLENTVLKQDCNDSSLLTFSISNGVICCGKITLRVNPVFKGQIAPSPLDETIEYKSKSRDYRYLY